MQSSMKLARDVRKTTEGDRNKLTWGRGRNGEPSGEQRPLKWWMRQRDKDGKQRDTYETETENHRYGEVKRRKETERERNGKKHDVFVLDRCERERGSSRGSSTRMRSNFSAVWRSEF